MFLVIEVVEVMQTREDRYTVLPSAFEVHFERYSRYFDMPFALVFIVQVPFVSVWPIFRVCVRSEKEDMPFILVIIRYPILEVPLVSIGPLFRTGTIQFRIAGS